MNKKRNIRFVLCLVLLVAGTVGSRLRWNVTPSMTPTLLWLDDAPPHVGDDVIFCAPEPIAAFGVERGYLHRAHVGGCESGVTLYKRLVARPGDRVQADDGEAPRINGVAWGGVPPAVDSFGRPSPVRRLDVRLLPGECYVLGEMHRSFDSRFFGPVPCARLRKVTPIF